MKKICLLLAVLMIFSTLMISCKGSKKNPAATTANQGDTTPPANSDAFDFTNVTVTRPKGSAQTLFSASKQVNVTYNNLTGKNLSIKDDLRAAEAGEILIGMTNRPESATAKEKLPAGERFAYAIVRIENKIAIVGTTDEMTVMGVNYFINNVLKANIAENGSLNIAKDYLHTETAQGVSLLSSNAYRLVIARALKDTVTDAANAMASSIKTLTGKEGRLNTDSKGKDEERNANPEILIGANYYPETVQVMSNFGYNEYGIAVVGKKVVVFGFSPETLAAAAELFELVVKNNLYNGELILPEGMLVKLSMTGSATTVQIPAYPAVLQSFTDAGEGGTLIRSSETTAEEFKAYGQALANDGFTLLSEHTAGDNIFFTYYKEKQTVTCNYHPTNHTADVIVDNEKNRPTSAAENQYETITATLFTQMSLTYITENAGMGYVMRLADGRFIVIDGGTNSYDEYKHLYEIILTQHQETGKSGKPVIAAWFLTHAHGDHYGNFQKFAQTYCPQYVTIESAVWNMGTSESNPSLQSIAAGIRSFFKNYLSKTKVYFARTGQRYHLANVTVDVLFTPDDMNIGNAENNSSCYFKITETVSGQTIMITGDSESAAAAYMVNRYSAGGLESDIMQQAHHGYWAGSVALYKLINPEIVFWPSPARWYFALYDDTFDRAWGSLASNKWITMESQKVKQIILAGNGDYTVTLPHTAIDSKPHTTAIKYDDGAVIFHQDFENSQLYNTGLGVIESHHESFTGTGFTLEKHNGQKSLYLIGGANSGLRIATPDMVRGNDIVTLTLDLDIVTLGNGLSIWYNDKNIENTKNASFYNIDKAGLIKLSIEINRANGTYKVYVNEQLHAQGTNACNDAGFIVLLSKNATIYVNEITLTAGTYEQQK